MEHDHENENERSQNEADETTSPNEPTESATSPPSNPALDEEAVRKAKRDLEQAGGGH